MGEWVDQSECSICWCNANHGNCQVSYWKSYCQPSPLWEQCPKVRHTLTHYTYTPHTTHSHRARTKLVYSIFSHAPPTIVLHNLHTLHVSHVIIEGAWCHKSHYIPGCSFSEVWNMEQPEYSQRPLFCNLIGQSDVPGFNVVFSNSDFTVLELLWG